MTSSLVYDVASRETFDALPRWFSEMEPYVSPSVIKIIVGESDKFQVQDKVLIVPGKGTRLTRCWILACIRKNAFH